MKREDDLDALAIDMAAANGATAEQWASLEWRLDNLYWIVDKTARECRFVLNDQQRDFIRNLWHRNLILKARQLGFSTLIELMQLDQALWNPNHTGVVIADTLPNASRLFGKIEFAYEHLPPLIKDAFTLAGQNTGSSLTFEHRDKAGNPRPARISVGVTARGGTTNLLHVSELGKIALKFPQRAAEIISGAIPSVPTDGIAIVESTAEGAFGHFYDLCEPAMKRREANKPETVLDWRLHFYPWFECKDYALTDADTAIVEIPDTFKRYFAKLEAELRITLTPNQRAWYVKTAETQGRKMKQEYPASPKEAFEQAVEGAVYGEQMTRLREQGRLTVVPLDPSYPVNTFWDFGLADATAIWFHQQIGLQHRWFYYIEGSGKDLRHWWISVCEAHRLRHGYQWGKHLLPHDADAEILGESITTKHRILDGLGMRNIRIVPRVATISQGIEITRKALSGNHWFYDRLPDRDNGEDMGAGDGIKTLDGYQFEWNDKLGVWSNEPLHNWASHGADAWRQYAQGWDATSSNPREEWDYPENKRRQRSWRIA
jgi:hypothetical protein